MDDILEELRSYSESEGYAIFDRAIEEIEALREHVFELDHMIHKAYFMALLTGQYVRETYGEDSLIYDHVSSIGDLLKGEEDE